MDDLVDRLRAAASRAAEMVEHYESSDDQESLLDAVDDFHTFSGAADELERLRALAAPDTPDGATPPDAEDAYQRGYDAGHADGYNDGRTDRYGPSPAVTAAERDVIEAAETYRAHTDPIGCPTCDAVLTAVDRLAAAATPKH